MPVSVDAAVSKEGLTIPLIDFSKFASGSPSERQQAAEAILKGFQTAGFIYLKNHPITQSTVKHAFSRSADFFAQPLEAKDELKWTTPQANRGYSGQGREKVTLKDVADASSLRAAAPDLKESFEIGRDDAAEHANNWPAPKGAMASWREDMMDFWGQCKALHIEVMRAIAVGMELGDGYFDRFVDVGDNTLRLLHYPAVKSDVFKINPGQVRAGEHSDYGSITLLFQDSRGGLQVRSPNGQFVDATPIEGTVVVNAGDLLARWSNDTIKSTIHRVVEPPSVAETHPPRYSIAYFCNPNFKDTIEALPGTFKTATDRKFGAITSGEYLVQRLSATY